MNEPIAPPLSRRFQFELSTFIVLQVFLASLLAFLAMVYRQWASADGEGPIYVHRPSIHLGSIEPEYIRTVPFTLTNRGWFPVTIAPGNSCADISYGGLVLQPGQTQTLWVNWIDLDARAVPGTIERSSARLWTTLRSQPHVSIELTANVVPVGDPAARQVMYPFNPAPWDSSTSSNP